MNVDNVFSGAGYIKPDRLKLPKMNGELPERDSVIILYEKCSTYRNPLFYVSLGTFQVTGFTNQLVICRKMDNALDYTTTFSITDFRCGLLCFARQGEEFLMAVV